MKFLTRAIIAIAFFQSTCIAQEVRPAAIAFAENNPVSAEEYVLQAKAYLIVKNNDLNQFPQQAHNEIRARAREFSAFNAGLFATYTAEKTLACLSWQSFDDVVAKHAQQVARSNDIQLPMATALVNLMFACLTKQESDKVSEGYERRKAGKVPIE